MSINNNRNVNLNSFQKIEGIRFEIEKDDKFSMREIKDNCNKIIENLESYFKNNMSDIEIYYGYRGGRPSEVEIYFTLYNKIEAMSHYEQGGAGFYCKNKENKYLHLIKLTNKEIFTGFDTLEGNNLQHNIKILDEVVKEIIKNKGE